LVKLVIEEPETADLTQHLRSSDALATSRLALVEVNRATKLTNPAPEVERDTSRLLGSCLLIDVSDRLLRVAAELASSAVRTLDAIHLATALDIEADEFLAYDRRLLDAAQAQGLAIANPGST
jgi:predicted nucleic acid-binding protein